ncbi:MAG: phosphoglucosamine mutase [Thermoguttaceae bacterium]|nr:phosphoglucosamine mutase [Thermoguttaceae bacterium]
MGRVEPIITVSGLRGVIGETLTPEVAIRYAAAYSACCTENAAEFGVESNTAGPFVICSDGRGSAAMLVAAVRAGLQAAGRATIDCGVCATPTVGILVRSLRAAGGIQISASHNPAKYNGIKLFSAAGRVIPAGPGAKVLEKYRAMRDMVEEPWVTHDRLGTDIAAPADCDGDHLTAVLAQVDVAKIRSRKFRVLLDSNHGAGGRLGRKLLESLGCEVVLLGEEPTGAFAHTPEPTAENLATVLAAVPEQCAAIGFCQDPDADRLAVIDQNGRYIGEEYTVAICAKHLLTPRQEGGLGRCGAVVTNCSTSRMTEDIAKAAGVPFFRSKVGEANVVDLMLAKQAVFAGEGNGGPIDPNVGGVRDSFVGMAFLLDAMAARQLPISQLADELPHYAIVKTKATVAAARVAAALDRLEAAFPDAVADRLDGLRLDWPTGAWLLLRASNTEPIVRAIAEAATEAEAAELCRKAQEILQAE